MSYLNYFVIIWINYTYNIIYFINGDYNKSKFNIKNNNIPSAVKMFFVFIFKTIS